MAVKKPVRRHVLYELMAKRPEPLRTARRGPRLWQRSGSKEQATPGSAAMRAEAAAASGGADDAPEGGTPSALRIRDGQVVIRANLLTGGIVVAAAMCLLVLVSFALGRRARGGPDDSSAVRIAAVSNGSIAAHEQQPSADGLNAAPDAAANPDAEALDRLTQPPGQPMAGDSGLAAEASQAEPREEAEIKLKYLWIQSIKTRTADDLAVAEGEARQIQEFLARENVPTTLTSVSNGIILKSAEGLPAGRDGAADRAAFQQRILQLGRLYRKQGGQYDFNGCFWN